MTKLEVTLAVALVAAIWLAIRLYRKHLVVRHLFIESSDWSARKIDEVVESASCEIIDLHSAWGAERGQSLTEEELQSVLPDAVVHAKRDWQKQVDALQLRLARNGIRPLRDGDYDLIFSPWFAGL